MLRRAARPTLAGGSASGDSARLTSEGPSFGSTVFRGVAMGDVTVATAVAVALPVIGIAADALGVSARGADCACTRSAETVTTLSAPAMRSGPRERRRAAGLSDAGAPATTICAPSARTDARTWRPFGSSMRIASCMACADEKRSTGSYFNARCTTAATSGGTQGATSASGAISCSQVLRTISPKVSPSPVVGRTPERASYMTTPSDQMSERGVAGAPVNCSGDMY